MSYMYEDTQDKIWRLEVVYFARAALVQRVQDLYDALDPFDDEFPQAALNILLAMEDNFTALEDWRDEAKLELMELNAW